MIGKNGKRIQLVFNNEDVENVVFREQEATKTSTALTFGNA